MGFVKSWAKKTCAISELKSGDVFTDFCNRSPRGIYMLVYHDNTNADEESVAYHMPYKALDLNILKNNPGKHPQIRFGNVFVRKGEITEEGLALVAGLVASEVE